MIRKAARLSSAQSPPVHEAYLLTSQVCGNGRAAAELRAWLQEWRPRRARAAGEAALIGSDSDGEWCQVVASSSSPEQGISCMLKSLRNKKMLLLQA